MVEQQTSDWAERKAAEMIARIKRSQWAADCFRDVRDFMSQGYVADAALQIAWNYWGR